MMKLEHKKFNKKFFGHKLIFVEFPFTSYFLKKKKKKKLLLKQLKTNSQARIRKWGTHNSITDP